MKKWIKRTAAVLALSLTLSGCSLANGEGSKAKETKERLDILNKSNDGFKIASEDLRLRGPGDLFGIRQSGLMDFRLGDVYQDAKILQKANEAADLLIQENSEWLQKIPEYESTASVII